jgi:hypothetical protein
MNASKISVLYPALSKTVAIYSRPKGRLAAGGSELGKNVCGGLMRSIFIVCTSRYGVL